MHISAGAAAHRPFLLEDTMPISKTLISIIVLVFGPKLAEANISDEQVAQIVEWIIQGGAALAAWLFRVNNGGPVNIFGLRIAKQPEQQAPAQHEGNTDGQSP
jgi:hypothetical protein